MSNHTGVAPSMSLVQVKDKFKMAKNEIETFLDFDAAIDVEYLEGQLAKTREADDNSNEPPTAPAVQEQLDEALGRLEQSRVRFVFQAISHVAWARVEAENPPSEEQVEAAKGRGVQPPPNDATTYMPAVIAKLLINPVGTEPDWVEWLGTIPDGLLNHLFAGAVGAQYKQLSPGKSVTA